MNNKRIASELVKVHRLIAGDEELADAIDELMGMISDATHFSRQLKIKFPVIAKAHKGLLDVYNELHSELGKL